MFNFPSSPTPGQAYIPVVGGPAYSWDGTVWRLTAGGISAGVYIGDTPPVNPPSGMLWFESDSGNTYIWFDDGTSAQWVQFNALATNAVVSTAEARNRIVNPAMQISQENVDAVGTTNGYYPADQWFAALVNGGVPQIARVSSTTPRGSKQRLRCFIATADAAVAAGDYLIPFCTKIEGSYIADFLYGTASAKQAILRFGWKSPAGVYSFSVLNNAQNRSYVQNFEVTAGQANQDLEFTFVIPGDTTGTWVNDASAAGVDIRWCIMAGSTLIGTAGWNAGAARATALNTNGMGVVSQTFELFDVGFHLDPNQTGLAPEWQLPDEAEELRACQRYWWKSYPPAAAPGAVGVTDGRIIVLAQGACNYLSVNIGLPTVMRVQPSAVVYNPVTGASASVRVDAADKPAVIAGSTNGLMININNSAVAVNQSMAAQAVLSARM